MALVDAFVSVFGVWEEVEPYLPIMFDDLEMQLVVSTHDRLVTQSQVSELLGLQHDQAAALLHRCYERSIVDKEEQADGTAYSPTSFYTFLNHFAIHENWDDIPAEDRQRIDRRFLDEFISRHRTNIQRKMQGLEAENALPNDTVLLLGEVEEMLRAAQHIVIQPCDCRRLGQHCDRPVEVCTWMDEGALGALARGHGRRVTVDEAIELVRWADKKGLMHTGDSEWRTRGLHAICNCCACDCYPFRAAQELGSKGIWPRSRYIAVYDADLCNLCGACVKRCHFDAFYHDGAIIEVEGKTKDQVRYDPERCWGCGLCANACPSSAISMEPWS